MSASPPTAARERTSRHFAFGLTADSCAAANFALWISLSMRTSTAHSVNPAFRKPSIISFAFFDSWLRAIHADIVKAGSILSTRAAASRASAARPRWAKADARQRYGPGYQGL